MQYVMPQGYSAHGIFADEILVDSVTIRNSAEECGQVTGDKIYIDIEMSCKSGATYEDCEARITVTGDINYDSKEFVLPEGDRIKKTVTFTMPSHSVNFTVKIVECDTFTADDLAHEQNYQIQNVTQEERDSCTPIIPPIDLSDIDLTAIAIGSATGGAIGLAFEGKSGAIQFGLLGGIGAAAYSYLTSAS